MAGAVSGVQQKRTLAHAPFTDDQTALFGPCGATFQIDFTYHNRKSLVDAVGLEPTVAFATVYETAALTIRRTRPLYHTIGYSPYYVNSHK